jgi:hypothetical protein
MIKTLVTLSECQIKRLKTHMKTSRLLDFLSYKKIEKSGEFTLLLTEAKKRLDKNKTLKKGDYIGINL